MKLTIKFATAALLAVSAVVPALAADPEAALLAERNTYVHANGAPQATDRAMNAFAQAPAQQRNVYGRDTGIGSQS